MNKLLILAVYPAPYRMSLYGWFKECFDCKFFCERSSGDGRDTEWFKGGDCLKLDTESGRKQYSQMNLKAYDLVALYDFTTFEAIKMIIKCRLKKIPYVINCDGVMLTNHGNVLRDMLKKFLIGGASGYLASGENAKKYFLKYGAKEEKIFLHTFSTLEKQDILADPVSAEDKRKLREKLALPADGKIAIAVGRFIPLKRYRELICEWRNMPSDCYLLLIGGGEEETLYRSAIEELNLNNVLVKPFYPKDELFEFYKTADIFVHPTSYDVWGLVVNEAMACGLPVVVSDHCIAGRELIKDGENGYKIPMGDDKAMCRRINEILSDDALRHSMGQNALDTIRPYTMENMAKTHIEAFQKITAR